MARLMFTSLLMASLAMASSIEAAEPRSSLPGFGGVAFGTPFADASKALAPDIKADKDPSDPKVNILLGQARVYDVPFGVNYTFDSKDRLSVVYTSARVPPVSSEADLAHCRSVWMTVLSGFKNDYGAPDSDLARLIHAKSGFERRM